MEPPRPDEGWSRRIEDLRNAVVVQPDTPRLRQRTGVLTAAGGYCETGATFRYGRHLTLRPEMPGTVGRDLPGTWLWGGVLFDHFGHFLVESIARFWALTQDVPAFDGILYVPKRLRRPDRLAGYQREILSLFGAPERVVIVREPMRVERLIVPGQGLGLGAISAGTPEMRQLVHETFAPGIAAEGPRRLYVSRSRLGVEQGAIIGEERLERLLEAEGYEVFHPQEHDIATQIARYRAAERLVIADGSAAHLYALVGGPQQKVAYLPRRSFWLEGPIEQIAGFCGAPPVVLPQPARVWVPHDQKRFRGIVYAQHDPRAVHAALHAAGFVSGVRWPEADPAEAARFLAAHGLEADFAEEGAPG